MVSGCDFHKGMHGVSMGVWTAGEQRRYAVIFTKGWGGMDVWTAAETKTISHCDFHHWTAAETKTLSHCDFH